MDGVTDLQPTTESDWTGARAAGVRAPGADHGRGFWAAVFLVGIVLGGLVGGVGVREVRKQQGALQMMREAVQGSLAPGEIVVVDDRLLAWALRSDGDAEMKQGVWAVSEDVQISSLLARMDAAKRREVVVVATPEDRLVRHLDEAGFSVAQEVGWVPWDLKGNGLSLLGRGKMRIYFAVAPADNGAAKR
jgi:hypothetical protein